MQARRQTERSLLAGLVEKYRTIRGMRAGASEHSRAQAREQMQALATRFPGALRELDELPETVIAERLAALEAVLASEGAPAERWMVLQASYHGHLRVALRVRPALRGAGGALEAVLDYVPAADEPGPAWLDARVREAIARPLHGRLNPWIFAEVARLHGTEPDEVRRALFLR